MSRRPRVRSFTLTAQSISVAVTCRGRRTATIPMIAVVISSLALQPPPVVANLRAQSLVAASAPPQTGSLHGRRALLAAAAAAAFTGAPQLAHAETLPLEKFDDASLSFMVPKGWNVGAWRAMQESDPEAVETAARASMREHVAAMVDFWNAGVPTLDYGNNIRQVALEEGLENAFAFPGFVPAYIRPLFCRGVGPFRWAALSGDPEDIYKTDQKVKELLPDNTHLHQWLDMARERISFQGLPARICWVGLGDRHRLGLAFNEMVRNGELKAPIVIGRDHLDSGSVASPNRETEAMKDGSDAVSDWPLLNALLNCASGATWVSLHHGGGVGMGFSQHSGMVICCDGSEDADRRLERVLWNDPATGVMRHADAGYDIALDCAREHDLNLPAILG